MKLFYIGIFGVLGVYTRYAMGMAVGKFLLSPFPYATLLINVIGSFLIGFVSALGVERGVLSADLRAGIMVGLLGGFTTYSTYCLEISHLIEEGEYWHMTLYFCLSNGVGILGVFGGLYLGRNLFNGGVS